MNRSVLVLLVLYVVVGGAIYLAALVGAALLVAAGMRLDDATLITATGAAGVAGGLFVWDVLYRWNRGGSP